MVREDPAMESRPSRPMRRWLVFVLTGTALAAIGALVLETKRLAELAGSFEAEARTARRERDEARLRGDTAADEARRLTSQLASATGQLQGITTVLEERTEQFRRVRAASEEAAARAMEPMSEGVRQCLLVLHECLRAEGFANQRFVQARRLDAEGLHEVEMFELAADGLGVAYYQAGRMTADLDRGKGRFVLRFFDGHRFADGQRQDLPVDGWPITFEPVEGRMLEQRLPFLVRCDGVYPADQTPRPDATDVDPITRRQWLERFDRVLGTAGTTEVLRIGRFRGMAGGFFLDAELIGTDDRHRVLTSAYVARLAIEVDRTTGVVSLLLQDGVLRRGGVESSISGEGYRMLLPKLDPKQASDLMFGMVVTK